MHSSTFPPKTWKREYSKSKNNSPVHGKSVSYCAFQEIWPYSLGHDSVAGHWSWLVSIDPGSQFLAFVLKSVIDLYIGDKKNNFILGYPTRKCCGVCIDLPKMIQKPSHPLFSVLLITCTYSHMCKYKDLD